MSPFFQFRNLAAQAGLRHAITRRWRPQPDGTMVEFNLGYRSAAHRLEDTAANWRYLAAELEIEPAQIVGAQQVHGGVVAPVGRANWGAGIRLQAFATSVEGADVVDQPPEQPAVANADGLVTAVPYTWLLCAYADCAPLLAYDPRQRAVGLAHAGWRGTVAGIGAEMVRQMAATFSSDPADILCGIGPAAGPESYQVSEEVIAAVLAAFPHQGETLLNFSGQPAGHALLDLWQANRSTLLAVGVPAANIEVAGISTLTNADQFFSARADGGLAGRFVAVIGLRGADAPTLRS